VAIQTSTIQVTVDDQIKTDATAYLAQFGMTVSDAVRILLTRVAKEGVESVGITCDQDSYDKWFRVQVQEALDNPRPTIPHDEVMAQARALIVEMRHAQS